jgi:hypothetical protein
MDPVEKVKDIAKRAQQRYQERQVQIPKAEGQKGIGEGVDTNKIPAKVVRLPIEAEEHRVAPNICLRSALFGVVGRGRRRWLIDTVIAAQDGYRVIHTGERLDQSDLDVWLAVKYLCTPHPLGTEVRFTAPQIFKLLRRTDGKQSREWLKRSLKRLREGSVSMINLRGGGFQGGLIDWWAWDDEAYEFYVVLSPRMAPLFWDEEYTLLAIEQRQKLSKDLSRWLHGYWSSHDRIYSIYDTTLIKLCGAEFGRVRDFRSGLREALAELEEVGFLEAGWGVNRHGLVTATKVPTIKALKRELRKKGDAINNQGG